MMSLLKENTKQKVLQMRNINFVNSVKTRNNIQKQVREYLMSVIDGTDYGAVTETEQQKKDFIKETFWSEYGFNVKRVGLQKACQDYLMGLPSSCSVEYWNDQIINMLKSWGVIKESMREATQYNKLDEYWIRLSSELSKIVRKD